MMGYIVSALYQVIALVFGGICWAINQFYAMILLLSKIDIFEQFKDMQNKIFMLMGLFIIFKLALSVIQYVIDPDKMTNSTFSAQKLLVRVVVVLALLGSIDTIFDVAMNIQDDILEEGILENFVFGQNSVEDKINPTLDEKTGLSNDKLGKYLSFAIFAPFIKYNDDAFSNIKGGCDNVSPFLQVANDGPYTKTSPKGNCYNAVAKVLKDKKGFEEALANKDLRKALQKSVGAIVNNKNAWDIDWFFGVVVGVICLIVLIVICVNVAIRAVKLSFLRVIAPIPIISYIDPNDKDGMFKKWLKMTINTYLDLFIRMLSFYFCIYVVTKIITEGLLGDEYKFATHPMLFVFFIIGTFLFAMQLPKIISDLTGVNTDGVAKGMKKGAGILGSAAVGGVGGMLTGFAAGISNKGFNLKGIGSGIGNAITGGAGATLRSGWNGRNAGNIGGVLSSARTGITQTSTVRNANAITALNGRNVRSRIPFASSVRASFGAMAGLKNTTAGEGYLKKDRKFYSQLKQDTEDSLQDWVQKRGVELANKTTASNNIEKINNQISTEVKKFEGMDGNYDQNKGDYMLELDGQTRGLSGMSHDDFYRSVQQRSSKLLSDYSMGKYSQQEYSRLQSNLDILKQMDIQAYESMKTNISQLHSQLTSEQANYNSAKSSMEHIDKTISEHREILQKANDGLNTTERNMNTLNKANGIK